MVRAQVMEGDAAYVGLAVGASCGTMQHLLLAFPFISRLYLQSRQTGLLTENQECCTSHFWFNPEYRFLCHRHLVYKNIMKLYYLVSQKVG